MNKTSMIETHIRFTDFVTKPGTISFTCHRKTGDEEIEKRYFFKFSVPALPSNATISLVLLDCMKALPVFRSVFFDLDVPTEIQGILDRMYQERHPNDRCSVSFSDEPRKRMRFIPWQKRPRVPARQYPYILLFSGGIDSLASHYLYQDVPLVSIVWESRDKGYDREHRAFKDYNPITISTNIRRFARVLHMPSIALLLQEYLGFKHIVYGDIFETPSAAIRNMQPFTRHPSSSVGLNGIAHAEKHPMHYANEVVTMMLLAHYCPEKIPISLESCAAEGTEKRYRKDLLAKITFQKYGLAQNFEITRPPDTPSPFGTHILADYLSLYMFKKLGADLVSSYITLPPDVIRAISDKDLSLQCYEKYNSNLIGCIPEGMRPSVLARLSLAGIEPFSERDWFEQREIARILEPWYPKINETSYVQLFKP